MYFNRFFSENYINFVSSFSFSFGVIVRILTSYVVATIENKYYNSLKQIDYFIKLLSLLLK